MGITMSTSLTSTCRVLFITSLIQVSFSSSQSQDLPFGFWFLGHDNPLLAGASSGAGARSGDGVSSDLQQGSAEPVVKQRSVRSFPGLLDREVDQEELRKLLDQVKAYSRQKQVIPTLGFKNSMKRYLPYFVMKRGPVNQQILPFPRLG